MLLPNPDDDLNTRNPLILVLDGVLSPLECTRLITRIEAAGPADAPVTTQRGFQMRPDIRNNTRVMFDDAPLAQVLFERVKAHLPARLETDWHLCGLNERLRCYRYAPGQFFAPHFDGAFNRSASEGSLLTVMVYLSACEAGGQTRFLDLDGHDVDPVPGRALIFNHLLLHEGAEVKQGLKYAIRSDVMFRKNHG